MLEQARRGLPGVTVVEGDMRSLRLGRRFDAIVCLFSSIGYMDSTEELNDAVGAMAGHLTPRGALIIDSWIRPDAWIDPGTVHAVAAKGDGVASARVGISQREGNKTYLEFQYLVATIDRIEYLVEHHTLTLFTDQQYQEAFRRAGIGVERADSDMPGRDRYIGVASR